MELESPWKTAGTTANLDHDLLRLTVIVDEPYRGMHDVHFRDRGLTDSCLLAIDLSSAGKKEPIAEHYVRGDDLVATLLQTPDRTFRPQFYWHALQSSVPGVELVISVQTSLLASEPMMSVGSRLTGCAAYFREGTAFQRATESSVRDSNVVLFRPEEADFTYAELVQPSDCEKLQIELTEDKVVNTRFDLFDHDLEKGVIRRGRLRSMFLPRANDEDVAMELLADLEKSAAPLTT